MTVVGKILVFLNLVFSLVVGAFAVLSYSASSNYAEGFKQLKSRYETVTATSDTYMKENKGLRDQLNTARGEMVKRGVKDADDFGEVAKRAGGVIDARDKRIAALESDLKDARAEVKAQREGRTVATGTSEDSTAAITRRNKELKDMRAAMDALSDKNGVLAKRVSSEMDLRVQATLDANTMREQNKNLEATQRELLRELARARSPVARGPSPSGGTPGSMTARPGSRDNPPPENVEASVKTISGDLVTITVGSDSGLEVGNTLKVFRLGTAPKYLAQIKLVSVEAKQAVGQVQGRPAAPIRLKDRVASNILGGY